MSLCLTNSLTRRKEAFVPLDPSRVTMYACGPTVYNSPHIGNARAAVVYDVLYRVLKRHYPNVIYARNITDVDDKINAAARERGVSISALTEEFTAAYHRDMQALGLLPPVIEPRATHHIAAIITMIERLISKGFAYAEADHVLFHVPAFNGYGQLSGRNQDEMIAGARVEVASYKRDAADFILWKPSSEELPGWDSPWGRGRPGWHIECSAMIEQHLGRTIDIHGGGNDLKFPHHENEIAQSTCAHDGELFCRYWVHNGFVEIDREKMSKSVGNVLLVKDLLEQHPGEAIRLALIKGRYREPMNWNEDLVTQAKAQLDRLYGALERLADVEHVESNPSNDFCTAMDDDLNTSQALAVLMDLSTQANTAKTDAEKRQVKSALLACGAELGILQQLPSVWFSTNPNVDIDEEKVNSLVALREVARAKKDWQAADQYRDELAAMGVQIKDGVNGTQWRV